MFRQIDHHHNHNFYDIILKGFPIAILLTLVWTLNNERPKKINIILGILTPVIAVGIFFGTIFLIFSFGFGTWVNESIIYESNENSKVTINQQLYDIGAFGYNGQRTVKITPFLGLWSYVEKIDTSNINKGSWTLVLKAGDIKFP